MGSVQRYTQYKVPSAPTQTKINVQVDPWGSVFVPKHARNLAAVVGGCVYVLVVSLSPVAIAYRSARTLANSAFTSFMSLGSLDANFPAAVFARA